MPLLAALALGALLLAPSVPADAAVSAVGRPFSGSNLAVYTRYSGARATFVSSSPRAVEDFAHWIGAFLGPKPESTNGFFMSSDDLQEAVALANERKESAANNRLIAFLTHFGLVSGEPGKWELKPEPIANGLVIAIDDPQVIQRKLAERRLHLASK